ncbi:MAG: hypothetical protein K9W44_14025 [Candidatus Lokiarchaeota archaeon]|nr:hypothetical protein [Candidatus Harpocratesius repetitus]
MKKIRLECTCGETFEYEIDPDQIKPEFGTSGILPILVSHNDHFITVYLDENLNPRSIERVLLVKDQESSVFVKSTSLLDVKDTIAKLIKSDDPNSHFLRFLSQVIQKIKNSEDLFIAGRITGRYLWQKRREPLLKMGASFSIDPELILKTELIPIFEKSAKIKVIQEDRQSIILKDTLSPQFIIGLAQGMLDAIQEYMHSVSIVIEYVMTGSTIFLNIKKSEQV